MAHYLPRDAQLAQPWKNGGGITRTLAVHPDGATLDAFDWRLSAADIAADGPFSTFPGIDRVLVLLRGAGLVLTVDGHAHALSTPGAMLRFPGEAHVHGQLTSGPTWDLNVMVRRGAAHAHVDVRAAGFRGDGWVVGLDGDVAVDGRPLDTGDLAWGEALDVQGNGRVVHVRVTAAALMPS